ncbi:MAG: valine--tRNA ligase [Bacteroidota bacterium]
MEIASKYEPTLTEDKWYSVWMNNKLFKSTPDHRKPYTIVIPPPNVTGVLHMGHMLNNSIQDILIRRARMQGFNACWVPGTDHASIATEAKVVAKLKDEGIDKSSLTREDFLKHAWQWKEKHGGIILEQLKKLGASCDWDRTSFTMDQTLSDSVVNVFVDLYNKGLIYRGVRMVNWDPSALTALSDEEVIHKEVQSKLYYLRYKIEGTDNEWVTIATTRPETILGDTAVCVHPEDARFAHLKGKRVLVPILNRSIPIIFDEYVDQEFGTGALKITPAHDINDYNLGIKYKLESIDIFNDNGTLNEKAQLYIGKDRFDVRNEIVIDLEKAGNLVKVEEYTNKVGYSERTNCVIEPKLSLQWFCKMQDMAAPALEIVMNDTIKFHPEKFKNTYAHWMNNIKDWCISRQLWWGHRIPAWHLSSSEFVVAKTAEEALEKAKLLNPNITADELHQDEDVLDTWFSSWLWPISVFDGINNPENEDIKYYYPTEALITAPEILFFWVARMIMAGLEYQKAIPFKDVYLTGIVRDKLHRKMSKSLGNSPDPIELMKIFGADGVRVGMLLSSPAGNDLLFDESMCEQGRNFNNKIWNALRLIKGWEVNTEIPQPDYAVPAIEWFEAKFNQTLETINDHFSKFRLSDALMSVYKLIWDDFCSWYLEAIKPAYQQPIDAKTYQKTVEIFERLMQVAHPFMPFITEEIWHLLTDREEKDCIMISKMPEVEKYSADILSSFERATEVIMSVRTIRQEKNIANKEKLSMQIIASSNDCDQTFESLILKLCNFETIEYTSEKASDTVGFVVNGVEYFVRLGNLIDIESEIKKIEEEIKYLQGFLNSVVKKLSNEKFVAGAPEQVVALERKKQSDAESKIALLTLQLSDLKKI